MTNQILLILADGFEEAEAVITIDVLRRLAFDVTIAGLDKKILTGAHNVVMTADALLQDVKGSDFQAVVLPGGMPGAKNLYDSDTVLRTLKNAYGNGAYIAAICAAPIVLSRAGLLAGRTFTAYPGFDEFFPGSKPTGKPTELDGRIITGKGPGATFAFVARIAAAFALEAECKALYANMFVTI